MYQSELITHLDSPRGDISGDPLDRLVMHLKELERFSEKLGAGSGLFLADQDGVLFGELNRSELTPIIKRIQGKIEKKIKEAKEEIRKKID